MNCPYCNKELEPIIGVCEDTEYYCQNCDYMTGDENLWNQLTKYKQALDIAVCALKELRPKEKKGCYLVPTVFTTQRIIDEALEQITALEQKGEIKCW